MCFKKKTLLQLYLLNYFLAFFVWLGSILKLTIETWFALFMSINVMYCALWGFWMVNKKYKPKKKKK